MPCVVFVKLQALCVQAVSTGVHAFSFRVGIPARGILDNGYTDDQWVGNSMVNVGDTS